MIMYRYLEILLTGMNRNRMKNSRYILRYCTGLPFKGFRKTANNLSQLVWEIIRGEGGGLFQLIFSETVRIKY